MYFINLMRSWWQTWRTLWRRHRRVQAERRALAVMLHQSAAWHCGCWEHRAIRGQAQNLPELPPERFVTQHRLFGFIPQASAPKESKP